MNKKPESKLSKDKASISTSKAAPKPPSKKTTPSQDQIAIRAYFISEERQRKGYDGDHLSDWVEAERLLKAE